MKCDSSMQGRERDIVVASAVPLIPRHGGAAKRTVYEGFGVVYKIERLIAHGVRAVIFVGMLGLGLIVGGQVFVRYVLAWPILGIQELAPLFALWAYFSGMVYATRERSHVRGGVLTLVVRRVRTMLFMRVVSSVLCIVTCGVLLYFVWDFFGYNVSLGRESPYMHWPWALWGCSMISGFVLMILYFSLQLALEVRVLLQPSRLP